LCQSHVRRGFTGGDIPPRACRSFGISATSVACRFSVYEPAASLCGTSRSLSGTRRTNLGVGWQKPEFNPEQVLPISQWRIRAHVVALRAARQCAHRYAVVPELQKAEHAGGLGSLQIRVRGISLQKIRQAADHRKADRCFLSLETVAVIQLAPSAVHGSKSLVDTELSSGPFTLHRHILFVLK
jgi:hypothetical protein